MRVPWLTRNNNNRVNGAFFEQVFRRQALSDGLYVRRNELSCRRVGSRWLPLKSQLDFTVCTREGRMGMFDCKSFEADRFVYSDLDPKQVDLAETLNRWKVPAGFVVYLEKTKTVMFLSGRAVVHAGPRSRFEAGSGIVLGRLERFDTRLLFQNTVETAILA